MERKDTISHQGYFGGGTTIFTIINIHGTLLICDNSRSVTTTTHTRRLCDPAIVEITLACSLPCTSSLGAIAYVVSLGDQAHRLSGDHLHRLSRRSGTLSLGGLTFVVSCVELAPKKGLIYCR